MTLKRKLNNLEFGSTSTGSTDIVSAVREHATTLAALLARIDALWWPHRNSKANCAIYQRQKRYRQLGIEWKSSGPDSTKWKSDERLRAELSRCGLVTLKKSSGSVYLKLTPLAESAVRQLCGLVFCPDEFLPHMMKIWQEKAADIDCGWVRPGGWIQENHFFGFEYEGRTKPSDWFESEETVVSLLISGAMECKTSTVGHLFYRLTGQPHVGGQVVDGIEADSAARDVYLDAWTDEFDSRENWQQLDPHEIVIPLSATR